MEAVAAAAVEEVVVGTVEVEVEGAASLSWAFSSSSTLLGDVSAAYLSPTLKAKGRLRV